MATTISLNFSICTTQLDHYHHHRHYLRRRQPLPVRAICKSFRTFSSSQSSSPTTNSTDLPSPSGKFLSNEEIESFQTLENFRYFHEFSHGCLRIRIMRVDELEITAGLLSESFVESMLLPSGYVFLLMFLVKQYLIERRGVVPHYATLLGFYRANDVDNGDDELEREGELAGTVEVSFDRKGANATPPTPSPPKDFPYICNMTVRKPLRRHNDAARYILKYFRKGIGWQLLKASEELISQMTSSTEVYLHCRMIDEAPFNMYTKAGYNVIKTDTILILLTLQRRKHLMRKMLLALKDPLEVDNLSTTLDEELSS